MSQLRPTGLTHLSKQPLKYSNFSFVYISSRLLYLNHHANLHGMLFFSPQMKTNRSIPLARTHCRRHGNESAFANSTTACNVKINCYLRNLMISRFITSDGSQSLCSIWNVLRFTWMLDHLLLFCRWQYRIEALSVNHLLAWDEWPCMQFQLVKLYDLHYRPFNKYRIRNFHPMTSNYFQFRLLSWWDNKRNWK